MAQKKKIASMMKQSVFVALFAVLVFFSAAHSASAATLYLSPNAGTYVAGHTFIINVDVSSPDAAMNAAQGMISFPADKLEVYSISKINSIANLWVQEPSFSNSNGTITFGAVVVNPGYTGSSGNIISITFRAKKAGTASIGFSSGSVLANDGKGTNILSGMRGATATLIAPSLAANGAGAAGGSPPAMTVAPQINDGTWYDLDTITFSWNLPANIDGINYAISNDPGYQLAQDPRSPTSSATYDLRQFTDGVWYFYVEFESGGAWSPAAQRVLRLDRTPPNPFTIVEKGQEPSSAPDPAFQWIATDNMSGIAYYRAKIGDGDWFDPASIAQGSSYVLPPQSPTQGRTLVVRAYDNAGNFREESIDFQILGAYCGNDPIWCNIIFFSEWNWWWICIIALAFLFSYLLLYRLFAWKREIRTQLIQFRKELESDLKDIDRDTGAASEKTAGPVSVPINHEFREENIKKTIGHVEDDVRAEIDKMEEL